MTEIKTEAERWKDAYDIAHDQATANGYALLAALSLQDELVEALEPFARAASTFGFAIGPDRIDDGLTVLAYAHARPEYEAQLCTSNFSRARALLTRIKSERDRT